MLIHVYWFRATGGYICGCGWPSNLVGCLNFFWNFLYIEKIKISFHIFFAFYAISNTFRKKHLQGDGKKMGGGAIYLFFLNTRKTILSHFISRFMLFPTFKKKKREILKIDFRGEGGGGGGGNGGFKKYFFFRKTILYHIISGFMLFPTFKKNAFCKILKSAPSLYSLTG